MPRDLRRWTTPVDLASYMGLCRRTVMNWIKEGELLASPHPPRHYTDDKPRKTDRPRWRIYEDDLLEFLTRIRASTLPSGRLWHKSQY